jgi:polysaccharide export outer membrane protein
MYHKYWLWPTVILLAGCAGLPTSGPDANEIMMTGVAPSDSKQSLQIIDVDDNVTRQLLTLRNQKLFSELLGNDHGKPIQVGAGDTLEVSIWEAMPATLFGTGLPDARGVQSTSRVTVIPEQVVNRKGTINIPFAGVIQAGGSSIQKIESDIAARLKNKANQPQVLVRSVRNASSMVTIVGEVTASTRMPLTPLGEKLLDALAAAGGVRQPVNKTTIQVTRGTSVQSLPLEMVIRDPGQNVPLQPGDVVTALFQPFSFTAMGATGKNEEINFEAQGISLAQALARSGGLLDSRANAQGVFIFRYEKKDALNWPMQPVITTPENLVPVIYRINLKNPKNFFVMQSFPVKNNDLLYVTNAPVTELQKFLNVVFSVSYPVLSAIQATK